MREKAKTLSNFLNMKDPTEVYSEAVKVISLIFPGFDFALIKKLFCDFLSLFDGSYEGYKKCDTRYHDVVHTTDTFLAMARLIHGATTQGVSFSEKGLILGLISALFHDAGYILREDEEGPGARFTLTHVLRSITFTKEYLRKNGYSKEDGLCCEAILKCTGLNVKMSEIRFMSKENEILGKLLGTADLLGQMADRMYLEKLPFLYLEFRTAHVEGLSTILNFLRETPDFFKLTLGRFAHELGGVNRYSRDHFRVRWGIDEDLYMGAIEGNIAYLKSVLEKCGERYSEYLRRVNFGVIAECERLRKEKRGEPLLSKRDSGKTGLMDGRFPPGKNASVQRRLYLIQISW